MLEAYFQAEECYSSDLEDYIVSNVLCLKDFGPWQTGCELAALCMDYSTGTLTEFTEDGEEVESIKLEVKPCH